MTADRDVLAGEIADGLLSKGAASHGSWLDGVSRVVADTVLASDWLEDVKREAAAVGWDRGALDVMEVRAVGSRYALVAKRPRPNNPYRDPAERTEGGAS